MAATDTMTSSHATGLARVPSPEVTGDEGENDDDDGGSGSGSGSDHNGPAVASFQQRPHSAAPTSFGFGQLGKPPSRRAPSPQKAQRPAAPSRAIASASAPAYVTIDRPPTRNRPSDTKVAWQNGPTVPASSADSNRVVPSASASASVPAPVPSSSDASPPLGWQSARILQQADRMAKGRPLYTQDVLGCFDVFESLESSTAVMPLIESIAQSLRDWKQAATSAASAPATDEAKLNTADGPKAAAIDPFSKAIQALRIKSYITVDAKSAKETIHSVWNPREITATVHVGCDLPRGTSAVAPALIPIPIAALCLQTPFSKEENTRIVVTDARIKDTHDLERQPVSLYAALAAHAGCTDPLNASRVRRSDFCPLLTDASAETIAARHVSANGDQSIGSTDDVLASPWNGNFASSPLWQMVYYHIGKGSGTYDKSITSNAIMDFMATQVCAEKPQTPTKVGLLLGYAISCDLAAACRRLLSIRTPVKPPPSPLSIPTLPLPLASLSTASQPSPPPTTASVVKPLVSTEELIDIQLVHSQAISDNYLLAMIVFHFAPMIARQMCKDNQKGELPSGVFAGFISEDPNTKSVYLQLPRSRLEPYLRAVGLASSLSGRILTLSKENLNPVGQPPLALAIAAPSALKRAMHFNLSVSISLALLGNDN